MLNTALLGDGSAVTWGQIGTSLWFQTDATSVVAVAAGFSYRLGLEERQHGD